MKKLLPIQPGDVPATYADVEDLTRDVGFAPATPIEEGIARFVQWYREFYKNEGCQALQIAWHPTVSRPEPTRYGQPTGTNPAPNMSR